MGDQRSSTPSEAPGHDLSQEREQFIRTFSRGAQLTKQFLEEFDALQSQLDALRQEGWSLFTVLDDNTGCDNLRLLVENLRKHPRFRLIDNSGSQDADIHQFHQILVLERLVCQAN